MVKFFVVWQTALLGDHPRSMHDHRSWLLIFLDGWLKRFSKTFIGNQIRAGEWVAIAMLQSNCSLFIDVLSVLHLAKIYTTEKMSPKHYRLENQHKQFFRLYKRYLNKHVNLYENQCSRALRKYFPLHINSVALCVCARARAILHKNFSRTWKSFIWLKKM